MLRLNAATERATSCQLGLGLLSRASLLRFVQICDPSADQVFALGARAPSVDHRQQIIHINRAIGVEVRWTLGANSP
jgi:hypothetical protein